MLSSSQLVLADTCCALVSCLHTAIRLQNEVLPTSTMKWKFVEALLHLAVALSFTDWNYRNEFDNSFAGTYIPNDISLGSANIPDSRVGPHSQTAKEEANIIDSIINWEETQRFSGFGRNTDFLAFPIVSQNSATSLEHIDSDPSSRSSLCSQQVGAISPGNAAGSTSSSEKMRYRYLSVSLRK